MPKISPEEKAAITKEALVLAKDLNEQLAELKKELAQAPPSEKKAIEQDILEFSKEELSPAKAKLARDEQALAACRAGSGAAA